MLLCGIATSGAALVVFVVVVDDAALVLGEVVVLEPEHEFPGFLSHLLSVRVRLESIASFELILTPTIGAELRIPITDRSNALPQERLAASDLRLDFSNLTDASTFYLALEPSFGRTR